MQEQPYKSKSWDAAWYMLEDSHSYKQREQDPEGCADADADHIDGCNKHDRTYD